MGCSKTGYRFHLIYSLSCQLMFVVLNSNIDRYPVLAISRHSLLTKQI